MRCKNQPALRTGIVVNGLLNGVKIVAALLDEKRLQIIQVHNPGIESLSAAAGTGEIFFRAALGLRARTTDRVRQTPESCSWQSFINGSLVAQNRGFESG